MICRMGPILTIQTANKEKTTKTEMILSDGASIYFIVIFSVFIWNPKRIR